MSKPIKVAVIAFDRISPFHLSVPCLVFGKDRRVGSSPWFELAVFAGESGMLMTSAGFAIHCSHTLDQIIGSDIVVVPSWRDVNEKPPQAIIEALREAYAQGALLVGLCLGSFVLAHAGLLSGKKATTHWKWAERMAKDFPNIEVDAKVLYVEQQQVLTSAGVAAGLDCCIHVVRKLYGREIANSLARQLVVAPHRHGGQAQFISQPVPNAENDKRLSQLLDWIRVNLEQPLSIDQLAKKMAMSRRSFTRHFKQITGSTYVKWLTDERVKAAQRQLETTRHSVEKIAADCGFGSSLSLRQHFSSIVGVSPTNYRKLYL